MIKKTIQYPFGESVYHDEYVHIKYNSDVKEVEADFAKLILKDIASFYGSQKYVIVCERGLNTNFKPEMLKILNVSKMKALAIVSEDSEDRRELLIREQELFKGSFAFFNTFEAAKDWALTFLD